MSVHFPYRVTIAVLVVILLPALASCVLNRSTERTGAEQMSVAETPISTAIAEELADMSNCTSYVDAVRAPANGISFTYSEISEGMRGLRECLGKPNAELLAYMGPYIKFNEALRGKRVEGWRGWVARAGELPDVSYKYANISMDAQRPEPSAALDVMLNQLSSEQYQKLTAHNQAVSEDAMQYVEFGGKITAVQFDGSVSLDDVVITPLE
ncbi:MAG TPA: hypothetical protein VF952_13720 [Chloroflexia bacterium]|jgi:hypothetical protein